MNATVPVAVSVVIVNWNAGSALGACVRSLVVHAPPEPWDLVIVDNASVDGSIAEALAAYPGATVIRNATNRGLAAANNQGIAATTGAAVLIANPDVLFAVGAIAAMHDALARHPKAAWIVPRLRYADGALQPSAGDLPTLAEAVLGRQRARARGSEAAGFWWDGWAHDREQEIGRGHEAAYLVRRAAIDDIGPQDEAFRLDWEGIDWTARARDRGWQIWFCPEAEVVHVGGVSIRQAKVRWVVSSHRGMYRYFALRRSWPWRPLLAVVFGLRALLKLAGLVPGWTTYQRGHR